MIKSVDITKQRISGCKNGFTIIEIIVVVVIFAMFAAFGLPGLGKITRKGRERAAVLSLMSINSANDIYTSKYGEFLPGAGLGIAALSAVHPTGLEININANNITYLYTRSSATAYTATADWTGSGAFQVRVDERLTTLADNPCCSSAVGTCPSLPACP